VKHHSFYEGFHYYTTKELAINILTKEVINKGSILSLQGKIGFMSFFPTQETSNESVIR
jgi:hypothetical protein